MKSSRAPSSTIAVVSGKYVHAAALPLVSERNQLKRPHTIALDDLPREWPFPGKRFSTRRSLRRIVPLSHTSCAKIEGDRVSKNLSVAG